MNKKIWIIILIAIIVIVGITVIILLLSNRENNNIDDPTENEISYYEHITYIPHDTNIPPDPDGNIRLEKCDDELGSSEIIAYRQISSNNCEFKESYLLDTGGYVARVYSCQRPDESILADVNWVGEYFNRYANCKNYPIENEYIYPNNYDNGENHYSDKASGDRYYHFSSITFNNSEKILRAYFPLESNELDGSVRFIIYDKDKQTSSLVGNVDVVVGGSYSKLYLPYQLADDDKSVILQACIGANLGAGGSQADKSYQKLDFEDGSLEHISDPNIDISDWDTYKNEEYGFEFRHPEMLEFNFPSTTYDYSECGEQLGDSFSLASSMHFGPTIYDFTVHSNSNELSPKDFFICKMTSLRQGNFDKDHIKQIEDITVGEQEISATKIIWELDYVNILIPYDDKIIELDASPGNTWDVNLDIFYKIISTFKFLD